MNHRHNAAMLLALTAPALIVLIAPRLEPLPGPSTAAANPATPTTTNPADPATTITTRRPPKLTQAQRHAIEHRQQLDPTTPIRNPFHHPAPAQASASPYEQQPDDEHNDPNDHAPEPPHIAISSISSANGTGIAIINGTLRRERESIAPGWTIERIDPMTRGVTLRHDSGAIRTITQDR